MQNTGTFFIGAAVGVVVGYIGSYIMMPTPVAPAAMPAPMGSAMDKMDKKMPMMADAMTDGTTVGGAKMVASMDIVDNAANAKNVTTVVSLIKLAGLVDTLKGTGPFTVFGPTNDAFAKLPKETVEAVQKPENKKLLTTVLTYHVVAGTYTSADLRVMAAKKESLTTVQGGKLLPVVQGGRLGLQDAKGGIAFIDTPDVISSNGVTHVVNSVLMPE